MNLLDITGFFVGVLINLLLVALICFYFKRKIDNLEVAQSEQAKMLFTIVSRENAALTHNVQGNSAIEASSVAEVQNNVIQGLDLSQLEDNEESDNSSDEQSDGSSSEEEETDDETNIEKDEVLEEMQDEVDTDDAVNEEDVEKPALDEQVLEEPTLEEPTLEEPVLEEPEVSDNVQLGEVEQSEENNVDVDNDFEEKNIVYNESSEENVSNDYEKMTVKALKNLLSEKGVNAKSSMSKPEIINLLKNNEE